MLLPFTIVLFTFGFTISMLLPEGNCVNITTTGNIAKPGCQTECGNLTVKYPFGIGEGCFLDESFELTCSTDEPPKLFIQSGNIQIYNISDSEAKIVNTFGYKCYDESGAVSDNFTGWYNLGDSAFTFSQKNKLTVIGCDDFAWIKQTPNGGDFTSGCLGFCSQESDVPNGYCSGIGCCQTPIPKSLRYYQAELSSFNNHTNVNGFNLCGFAFLSEEGSFHFGGVNDLIDTKFDVRTEGLLPITVDWAVGGGIVSCSQATACKGNSSCNDADTGWYRCSCNEGYHGNPYLDPGCVDINECEDKSNYPCYGDCINTPGSYNCTCFPGQTGIGTIRDGCRPVAKNPKIRALVIALDPFYASS